ncbi:MAG: hemolysin III family protein [Clostridia bacterium]|nr:hemolysin III family protein [Clostridia bacterium]
MVAKEVKLIEYSKNVDMGNCITHAVGAVLSVAAIIAMMISARGTRQIVSVLIFGITMLTVYTVSAVYHGMKNGEAKRIARLLDHSAIPLLIAGTTTPCALVALYDISTVHGIAVLSAAWFCALFGLISKLFFFEKLKKITYAVYIICCSAMLFSAIPVIDKMEKGAFGLIALGCILYLVGAIFCYLGVKREKFHVVFHVFVLLASAVHFYVIYTIIIR